MPKGYNSLNDMKTNPYEIGICPICSVRLTHGCEHSQTQTAQEWLAAVIVAEHEAATPEPVQLVHTPFERLAETYEEDTNERRDLWNMGRGI
jgi:RNA polymerase subunit RPABC4/transcription elongation factor Spt4